MIRRLLAAVAFLLTFAAPAWGADLKVATVDFQRALNEVNEASTVRTNLEKMYGDRKAAIDKMQQSLVARKADLDKQSVVLSDSARKQKEDEFNKAQMEFQQTYSRYEGEMQQAYYGAMEQFIEKMKKIAVAIGQERQYTLVLEVTEGGVVYAAPALDITEEVIKRYNAANPGPAAGK